MKAAVMERGAFRVETLDDPVPGPGEVIAKSVACGICGSDLHAARHTEDFVATSREAGGAFKLTTFDPVVLGHEFCAEVVDFGPGEAPAGIHVGDHVCSVPMLARQPVAPVGYSPEAPGGFAEYMLLTAELLQRVPTGLPPSHAALTEPMAVGYHAVNMARLEGGETTLVIGAGPVGLAVVAALKARRADANAKAPGAILVAEYSPERRRLAESLGADTVVDPAERSPWQLPEVAKREPIVAFECVGVPGVIDQMFLGTPRHSRLVVVGVCLQTDHARPLIAINKELNVQYVLGYTGEEFAETLHLIADGVLPVEPIITHTVGLDGVGEAFETLATPNQQGKVLVAPWNA